MISLEVLISTLGSDGICRVARMELPEAEGVTYLVCWQKSDGVEIPAGLASRTDVRIIRNSGIGLSRNRNYALEHASGDVLLIADDDLKYTAASLEAVRQVFEKDPAFEIGLFRYCNERGEHAKTYPCESVVITDRLPKGYYTTSVEMAVRRSGKAASLRFCEALGLGAPVLKCGEEELFLLDARRKGCKVRFFPLDICVHTGKPTGLTKVIDNGVYRGIGAVTSLLYPLTFPLRFFLMAWRGRRSGRMEFIPAVFNFFYGAAYMALCITPFRGVHKS